MKTSCSQIALCVLLLSWASPSVAQTLYSIGQPTNEEQLFLELINRARANPTAEGQRLAATRDADVLNAYKYFGVDLTLMQQEFAALPVRPPLAFNAQLIAAARGHSVDMYENEFQGHTSSGGASAGTRLTQAGYNWNSYGENVFAYADSVWQGHAGFQVDWGGGGTGGMQKGRGHRMNIHGTFREVGIGVKLGSKGSVGPMLVTQDFATSFNSPAFITGVAYEDDNTNSFYDIGEGLSGVTVTLSGVSAYAITSDSGGYAVPVPTTNTTRTLTFSHEGRSRSQQVTISGGANVKVDYVAGDDDDSNPFAALPRGDWANVPNFGWCYGTSADWTYHLQLGHLYTATYPWLYKPGTGYLYYAGGSYPSGGCTLYSPTLGYLWLAEPYGTWAYRYSTGTWVSL